MTISSSNVLSCSHLFVKCLPRMIRAPLIYLQLTITNLQLSIKRDWQIMLKEPLIYLRLLIKWDSFCFTSSHIYLSVSVKWDSIIKFTAPLVYEWKSFKQEWKRHIFIYYCLSNETPNNVQNTSFCLIRVYQIKLPSNYASHLFLSAYQMRLQSNSFLI